MKFAHKITNVAGGNKLVTVSEHNGQALVQALRNRPRFIA